MAKLKLWVKFGSNSATQVSTQGCRNVDDFLEACKKKLSHKLGAYDVDQLSLSTSADGPSLRPGLLLSALPSQPGYSPNDDEHPLFISVADGPDVNSVTAPPPPREPSRMEQDLSREMQHLKISGLTTQLKAFANAQLVDGCIQSPDQTLLPYTQDKIKKLYVRECYQDVFDLLLEGITRGLESFAISGTPGIGKSLFFVYILHRLMDDFSTKTLSLKPNRVVYQTGSNIECFDLQQQLVTEITKFEAVRLVREQDTLYVIDGRTSEPLNSSCITLFISSPRSESYKAFVKQRMAKEWLFPVWTLAELQTCQRHCYPLLPIEMLQERHRIYGGVARIVLYKDYSIAVPKIMEKALADVDAVNGVRNIGTLTKMFPTTHTLLHAIVSTDGLYQFRYVDIASKYVGEQLWIRHSAKMLTNLQDMFGGSPNEISRHLFEIYGHVVFSVGGQTLKCKCLESGTVTKMTLDALHGQRFTFGKDTIPSDKELLGKYFEPTDDDSFPAIDSLSPQGMFQFTVAAAHPVRGVQILQRLCELYKEPKLYFVVPPHRFATFKKQSFKGKKGTDDMNEILKLEQYVLELPVLPVRDGQTFFEL